MSASVSSQKYVDIGTWESHIYLFSPTSMEATLAETSFARDGMSYSGLRRVKRS